jgi:glutaredoxin/glutathione-dependent peroxiredoxin
MPSLRLGSIAPDFEAETTAGPIKFHDWIGSESWVYMLRDSYFSGVLTRNLVIGDLVLAPG